MSERDPEHVPEKWPRFADKNMRQNKESTACSDSEGTEHAVAERDVVNGETRLFGILGHPIAQVKSPALASARFRAAGINAILLPFHVAPADLATFMQAARILRNLDGMAVTVPHKHAILDLVDDVTPQARQVGASNVIRREPSGRWLAHTLDGAGFTLGLKGQGIDPKGRDVLLVGAGGAASAIAPALIACGIRSLAIHDVVAARAAALAERTGRGGVPVSARGSADPAGCDLIVNATPLGMKADDPLPLDVSKLTPSMIVADIIMEPPTTRLLEEARARGCRIHHGIHMTTYQLDALIDFVTHGRYGRTPQAPP